MLNRKKEGHFNSNITNANNSNEAQTSKRTFEHIRLCIIFSLYSKEKPINTISTETGINWKTVESHLVYLLGRKYVEEVLTSEYARIFRLSDKGREFVDNYMVTITKVLASGKIDNETKRRLRI